MNPRHRLKIFISYRRDDSAYVAATINDRLERRFGNDSVFFDIDTIPLGTDFRNHIENAVAKCDVLLAIIGDTWLGVSDDHGNRRLNDPADHVRLEIESALSRGISVIPVLIGDAQIPPADDLPSSLRDLRFRNATEVRAGRDLQQHLSRLVAGVETVCQSRYTNNDAARVGNAASDSRSGTYNKRRVFTILAFVISLAVSCGAGMITSEVILRGGRVNVPYFFFVAVPTLIVGLLITYVVWRRFKDA